MTIMKKKKRIITTQIVKMVLGLQASRDVI